MNVPLKLSSPATHEFWEVRVLYEDEHLLAVDKPQGLLTSHDRLEPDRPSLMRLLHQGIERGASWAKMHSLGYLMNAHRLDPDTSGVLLLAKSKAMLVSLANAFGSEQPVRSYVALVQGSPSENDFQAEGKIARHPIRPGMMMIDPKAGKRSSTRFTVMERFQRHTLLRCQPLTERNHQVRLHAKSLGHPLAGDTLYGGKVLNLSSIKPAYRLKPGAEERPLIRYAALHAEALNLLHPVTGQPLSIAAAWPKDLTVAVKYLRRYSALA